MEEVILLRREVAELRKLVRITSQGREKDLDVSRGRVEEVSPFAGASLDREGFNRDKEQQAEGSEPFKDEQEHAGRSYSPGWADLLFEAAKPRER